MESTTGRGQTRLTRHVISGARGATPREDTKRRNPVSRAVTQCRRLLHRPYPCQQASTDCLCSDTGWDLCARAAAYFPDEVVVCGVAPAASPMRTRDCRLRQRSTAPSMNTALATELRRDYLLAEPRPHRSGRQRREVVAITQMADKAARITLAQCRPAARASCPNPSSTESPTAPTNTIDSASLELTTSTGQRSPTGSKFMQPIYHDRQSATFAFRRTRMRAAQAEMEAQIVAAIEKLGRQVKRGHAVDPKRATALSTPEVWHEVFRGIPKGAPLIVAEPFAVLPPCRCTALSRIEGPISSHWRTGAEPGRVSSQA